MSSGALVDVTAENAALRRILSQWREAGGDLTSTMEIVAETLVSAVSDEFHTEGRGRWPKLAESTLRKRRGTEAQILQDTGRFAGSIQAEAGPDWAEASTDVSYASYHVSDEPRFVIPLRNPFDVPDEVLDEAMMMILNDMMAHLERAGGGPL